MLTSLELATEQLARALTLLDRFLADLRGPASLLRLLGWDLPPGVQDIGLAAVDLAALNDRLERLDIVLADEQAGDLEVADAYAELVIAFAQALDQLRAVAADLNAAPDYLARTNIRDEFVPRLLDLMVMQTITAMAEPAFSIGRLVGVFVLEQHPADPARFQVEHIRHVVRWDRLGQLLTEPVSLFRDVYGWGTPDFDAGSLIVNIASVLQHTAASGRLRPLPRRVEERLAGRPVPEGDAEPAVQLNVSLLKGVGFDPLDVGLSLYPLRPSAASGADGGLGISPYVAGTTEVSFPLGERLTLLLDATVDLQGGVAIVLRPGDARLETDLDRPLQGRRGDGQLMLSLRSHASPDSRMVLLVLPGGTSLEAAALSVGGGVHAGVPAVEVDLEGGRLVVDASQGDGFLASVLSDARAAANFDVGAAFSRGGLSFHGSGGLEIQLPVHERLGPIDLHAVYLAARADGVSIAVELSISFGARLGPIVASVDRLGALGDVSFPDGGGNLGPTHVDVAFKPPNGVGLAIDLAEVSGGGFLRTDPETGEYFGALELEFADFLTLKALGLISTRMPGGARGFSLLIVVAAEFPGGLQLGYGFKLLAVGGLIGLERTMREQALLDGVRSGALESIMFPRDVVGNAPRILSDLRTFFPPQAGHFLIAPMAKLAWGTPTLITASVGVIIEIPGNVALIGVLKVVLPTEHAPVVRLQVNFAGVIDFDGQRAHLLAALFDSRVLTTPIDGEMGVLARWGDDPNLVLTVGGFHPAFTPPPLPFPTPRRVSLDILNRSNARLQVSGYFAVTSNTAQFGAHAELFFKFSAFQVEGHVGFDALFRFSPFAFQIDVSASVSLKAFGVGCFSISLRFALEGPTPWRAHGRGSVSLFFFDISADFDLTWGEERDTTLPPIDVLPLVAAELFKLEGWETRTPARKTLVSLRRLPATEDQLVLHPTGTLFVRQRAVPLDLTLDRIGSQRPRDVNRVSVDVAGDGLVKRGDTGEMFAPAQFQDMDDAAKLSRPAFERQHGGLELAPDGTALASARAVRRTVRYEQIVFDEGFRRRPRRFTPYGSTLFNHLMAGNSVSRSPLSHARRTQTQPFPDTIGLAGDSFTVAHTRDNTAAAPAVASDAAARDLLAHRLAEEPELAGSLHVIPTAEVRG